MSAGLVMLAACGSTPDATSSADLGESKNLSGVISVSGSSTVEPITSKVAELYSQREPGVDIKVDGPGTGDGFKLFCDGETDISDASRTIKEEEASSCAANGVNYVEIKVAFDGMTVMTNPANAAVACLNFNDLYALVGPEANRVDTWAAATAVASELGSTTALPDAPLEIFGPGAESGTYDSFIEIAFKDPEAARLAAGRITEDQVGSTRTDYNASADDNAIILGIEANDTALGWVGFAYAEEQGDKIKELEVDGGDGCVSPSVETIADGSYPLSRALYIYVNSDRAASNEALVDFVDVYLDAAYTEGVTKAFGDTGYVALPDDQLTESRNAWAGR
jgi:phosphate transport system substrate-binding protein